MGALSSRSGTKTNDYQYNGKELNTELDLNWTDYGARWYNPQLARWSSVDPLAEKYDAWSPYNYVMNNPLIFVDPDGRSPWTPDEYNVYVKSNDDGNYTTTGQVVKVGTEGGDKKDIINYVEEVAGQTKHIGTQEVENPDPENQKKASFDEPGQWNLSSGEITPEFGIPILDQLKKGGVRKIGQSLGAIVWKKVMSGKEVKKMLKKNGYEISTKRGKGSHSRASKNGKGVTIPEHDPIAKGTLGNIKREVRDIEELNN